MRGVVTVGYEGATIEDFVETLKKAGAGTVLDVRELPVSRRKGFSKSALSAHLAEAGIGYRHEKRLGSPSDIRNRLRESGDFDEYFAAFDRYLETQLDLVAELVHDMKGTVALVCYERNPDECHRRSVAARMAEITKTKPRHLGVAKGISDGARQEAGLHPGKGLPAAKPRVRGNGLLRGSHS